MFADTLSSCPSDHPFPFGEGVHCCRYHARSSACQSGPAGTDLEMNDSPECCIEDDSVLCVNDGGSETVCNTHENAECELKLLGLLGFHLHKYRGIHSQFKGIKNFHP